MEVRRPVCKVTVCHIFQQPKPTKWNCIHLMIRSIASSVTGNPFFTFLYNGDLEYKYGRSTTALTRCITRAVVMITSAQTAETIQTIPGPWRLWNLTNWWRIAAPIVKPTEPRIPATLSSTIAKTTNGLFVRTWMRQAKNSWTDPPIIP